MMTPTRAARSIVLAATMSLCGAISARAEFYTVTKVLWPTIAETQYIARAHRDQYSCWPDLCLFAVPHDLQAEAPFFPDVLVGFQHFADPGTEPCPCVEYHSFAYRASVLFRAEDIPHCDKCEIQTATLMLEPQRVERKNSILQDLIGGLFEVGYAQAPTFDDSYAMLANAVDAGVAGFWALSSVGPGLLVHYSPNDGRVVLTRRNRYESFPQEENPVIDPFPLRPGPSDFPVKKNPGFDYRIDVTSTVKKWIVDSPNVSGLHGFVIAGLNEVLPKDENETLLVEYFVRLEVVYHEPVM